MKTLISNMTSEEVVKYGSKEQMRAALDELIYGDFSIPELEYTVDVLEDQIETMQSQINAAKHLLNSLEVKLNECENLSDFRLAFKKAVDKSIL